MNQVKALEDISKGLGVLTYQVSQENMSAQYTKNRIIEDLLLPIFRRIFSAPQLRNLNAATQNHPSLDLADDEARVSIQVTTESTSAKITKTLQGFLDGSLHKRYDRLVIFLLIADRPRFTAPTRAKWAEMCRRRLSFDPSRDIVALPQLLSLIQGRPFAEISEIRDVVARSIVGEEFVDVLAQSHRVSSKHVAYEKRTGRYIPGVFVETRETKQLARCFCHPVLFFQRSAESTKLLNLLRWNRFLDQQAFPRYPSRSFRRSPMKTLYPGSRMRPLVPPTAWKHWWQQSKTTKAMSTDRLSLRLSRPRKEHFLSRMRTHCETNYRRCLTT